MNNFTGDVEDLANALLGGMSIEVLARSGGCAPWSPPRIASCWRKDRTLFKSEDSSVEMDEFKSGCRRKLLAMQIN